ncbi:MULTISPECIES: hypothetical protein [Myroides]|uniref:Uncharacterized protein n=1 Tax=Myroides albus TaxID=2562892 RepID=A0A6I3LHI6_9FLAO|nr:MULTISPECIES: hypothetical protein [Myroides]MTG97046.1 hypothetical protein [Myroides albus]MVX36005.1 hypothetical protein [Myroides sp. LoEW2-1]
MKHLLWTAATILLSFWYIMHFIFKTDSMFKQIFLIAAISIAIYNIIINPYPKK